MPASEPGGIRSGAIRRSLERLQGIVAALAARVVATESAVADSGWIVVGSGGSAPAFQNSWTNYDAGTSWEDARFRKIGNQVFIQGLVKDGTYGNAIFTLPVGYRPPAHVLFATDYVGNFHARLDVGSTGNVLVASGPGSNAHVSINCFFFTD